MNIVFYSYLNEKKIGINTGLVLLILFLSLLNLFDIKYLSSIYFFKLIPFLLQIKNVFVTLVALSCNWNNPPDV